MAVIMMFVALVWTTLSQGHPTNIWVLKRPMASRGMLQSKLVDFFRAPTQKRSAELVHGQKAQTHFLLKRSSRPMRAMSPSLLSRSKTLAMKMMMETCCRIKLRI